MRRRLRVSIACRVLIQHRETNWAHRTPRAADPTSGPVRGHATRNPGHPKARSASTSPRREPGTGARTLPPECPGTSTSFRKRFPGRTADEYTSSATCSARVGGPPTTPVAIGRSCGPRSEDPHRRSRQRRVQRPETAIRTRVEAPTRLRILSNHAVSWRAVTSTRVVVLLGCVVMRRVYVRKLPLV